MSQFCEADQERYWDRAQQLLILSGLPPELPEDVWASCTGCSHVGWRWRHGPAELLCQGCRRARLALDSAGPASGVDHV